MKESQLIIFIKNPIEGTVKTRLAKTVGTKKALEIYLQLLNYTTELCKKVIAEKTVFYSDFIPTEDQFTRAGFRQAIQHGDDLGARMKNALTVSLTNGAKKCILIGSDCPLLTEAHIEKAFAALDHHDCILGPALDGGYYLIGMKKVYPFLFEKITWSTSEVLTVTIKNINENDLACFHLETLPDIDEEKDLEYLPNVVSHHTHL